MPSALVPTNFSSRAAGYLMRGEPSLSLLPIPSLPPSPAPFVSRLLDQPPSPNLSFATMATTRSSSHEHDREKGELSSDRSPSTHSEPGLHDKHAHINDEGAIVVEKSRGVVGMENLYSRLTTKYRVLLYGGFALLAYVMSLEQYTNGTYRSTATSVSFNAHSTLATIASIKSVFQVSGTHA